MYLFTIKVATGTMFKIYARSTDEAYSKIEGIYDGTPEERMTCELIEEILELPSENRSR